jgi:hypothetical protein
MLQDTSLLFSSASALLPALPFYFMTPELHIVPALSVQSGNIDPSLQVLKYYFQSHVREVQEDFHNLKKRGSHVAEEWFRTVEAKGKDILVDVLKWEKWESQGGLASLWEKPANTSHAREPSGLLSGGQVDVKAAQAAQQLQGE